MNETNDWTYIRAFTEAGRLAAAVAEPGDTVDAVLDVVYSFTKGLYELQQTQIEEFGLFTNTEPAPSKYPTSKPSSSSSRNSKPRSSNSSNRSSSGGGGLQMSEKQEKFFGGLISEIKGMGGDPVYSIDDLNGSGSYDERQARVRELIEQRDELKF